MHPNHTAEPRLECYGADYALLQPEPEDIRYWITDQGRRALAMASLFDQAPSVAAARRTSICPACRPLQTAPSCAAREHWGC